jgi:extracellular elastinolytic metalloproteinase
MGVQLDKRDFSYEAVGEAAALDLEPFGAEPHGLQTYAAEPHGAAPEVDPFTGSIRSLQFSTDGLEHLSTRLTAMELAKQASMATSSFIDSEPAEFGLPQDVTKTLAGAEVVHLQQLHRGIPVFQSGRTVQLRPSGQAAVTGAAVEALHESESDPRLDAREAVIMAARFIVAADAADDSEDLEDGEGLNDQTPEVGPLMLPDDFQPLQTATFDLPAQPTTFSAEPFEGPIKASLVYLYMGPYVRLTWQVELVFPGGAADYAVLVAAGESEPGEILYAADRVSALRGECDIHARNPAETPRASTPLPPPAGSLPVTLGPPTPVRDWIGAKPVTSGNNVECQTHGAPGVVSGGLIGGLVKFGPFGSMPSQDHATHAFYHCNIMHDFFEALGFDEPSGNFQLVNFSGASGGGDPVDAIVFARPVKGLASMYTPPDGARPTLRMGPQRVSMRHSALDSEIVYHEYTHGVTSRLVGGRFNRNSLSRHQSRGLGEGWSDFFALSFHNVLRDDDKLVIGNWVKDNKSGLRRFPYDCAFPDKFDDLGQGRYIGVYPHAIGEIWCATLMMAIRCLAAVLGDKPRAYAIVWQCVVDGLKATPASPSFLDARDAISRAIDDLAGARRITDDEHTATRRCFWEAFAYFRMGINASCPGAGLVNIVGDDTLPADVTTEIAAQKAQIEELRQHEVAAHEEWRLARYQVLRARAHHGSAEVIAGLLETQRLTAREHTEAQEAHEQAKRRLEELQKRPCTLVPGC